MPPAESPTLPERKEITFFVSYAHRDNRLVHALVDELQVLWGSSKRYTIKLWADWELCLGESWKEEIFRAIEACDFGLLMLSPAFLNSSFIVEQELPKLERVLPVALKAIDLSRQNLHGLEDKQIFFHRSARKNQIAYRDADREGFAMALYQQIEARLGRIYG